MLKALEMFGFKSFADRTRFDFAPGVTCVVGPNGSGKSNVVDALKWILGDQSPKSLRGKEMTDVIFNGSASRKPTGFAEATLTFDNSKNLLNVDTSEVQVGRRIYRSELTKRLDPRGRPYYWIGATPPQGELEQGTDLAAVAEKHISLTPLHLDLTDYRSIELLSGMAKQLDGVGNSR